MPRATPAEIPLLISIRNLLRTPVSTVRRAAPGPIRCKRETVPARVASGWPRSWLRACQLPGQPRLGHHPIALHGGVGYLEHLRGLLHGEAAEEPEFHDLRLPMIERIEPCQRRVDADEVGVRGLRARGALRPEHQVLAEPFEGSACGIDTDVDHAGAALFCKTRARLVQQN